LPPKRSSCTVTAVRRRSTRSWPTCKRAAPRSNRGRPAPPASEALAALASARTERTAAILLDQFSGALRRAMDDLKGLLADRRAPAADALLTRLRSLEPVGRLLTQPGRVVLIGQTNVGKSSLLNALVGYGRAIVDAAPGTTRDVVAASVVLDGWPVELADTAGQRTATDELESRGTELARLQAAAADVVLLVCDRSQGWSAADVALAAEFPRAVLVHNKSDLPRADDPLLRPTGIAVSALTGDGIDQVARAVVVRLVPALPQAGEAVPFAPRHWHALRQAQEAVWRGDLALAASLLP
jgi:tRNA modification GTPase